MGSSIDPVLLEWLSSSENPPVRFLTSRDLIRPRPSAARLRELRDRVRRWAPLQEVLDLQLPDGSFPETRKTQTARSTFWALALMHRCGLDVSDEPVVRAIEYLTARHLRKGAVSYTGGGSGVLPCYAGVVTTALVGMGALDTELAQASLRWLIDHQRFDHKAVRAGGAGTWPYRTPRNFGCWESVSCYHGVAGAFRALATIPPEQRSAPVRQRLEEALAYLRIHRLYKKSSVERPLFRHMTQFFLVGDYRSDLLDMLQGVADAEPRLIREDWVRTAVREMDESSPGGRVTLVKNYGRSLIDPIPLESVGAPSRFLSFQWLRIQSCFEAGSAA